MGKKVPHSIKLQVLNDWLSGKSRDDIAINNSISNGSVTNIIKEFRETEVPDIDLLRGAAVYMKRHNLGLNEMSSSIRLKNMLDNLELPDDLLEKFLLALSIYNYKNDLDDPKKFIHAVEKVSDYVFRLDVTVFHIINEIDNKQIELKKLKSEILDASMKLGNIKYEHEQLLKDNKLTNVSQTLGDGGDTNKQ
ncbi:MAG TPA: hypothetical protein VJR94_07490 [Candidatus Nitrosocosmicus sp.]|nr:hypothetical protein [Candidatus Nitrosocosmicus sp.]